MYHRISQSYADLVPRFVGLFRGDQGFGAEDVLVTVGGELEVASFDDLSMEQK